MPCSGLSSLFDITRVSLTYMGLDLGPIFYLWTIHLSISPSQKIQMLLSSLSHSIFEKKRKIRLWASLRVLGILYEKALQMPTLETLSTTKHIKELSVLFFFFSFFFFFCFCAFVFFFLLLLLLLFPYVLYLYSLFISTSKIFSEKFPAKYHCILYLSFNVLHDSGKKELTQKINGWPVKVRKEALFVFF